MTSTINSDTFKQDGTSIKTYISKQFSAMLLIHNFRDDNADENVDTKISELATHTNLEKKLDFPAK